MGEPLRGEVWDIVYPQVGVHPGLILSINPLNAQLGSVATLIITGTAGPPETHVRIGTEAGVTKYPESFVNITDVHAVHKSRVRRFRGRLDPPTELDHVCDLVRIYLGL